MNSGYKLELSRKAWKFLQKQDKIMQRRIAKAFDLLLRIPPQGDIRPMSGSELFRLRVGAYRVLFFIDHDKKIVYIETIGNRGDVYK